MALGGEEGVERRASMNTTCISLQGRCPQRAGKSGVAPTQTELTESREGGLADFQWKRAARKKRYCTKPPPERFCVRGKSGAGCYRARR